MEIKRVFDVLELFKNEYSSKADAFASKENGKWISWSARQYVETSNLVSYGLLSLGLKKGDMIATISNNRPEWNIMDMGMSQAGVVHVPIYPTISREDYEYIFNHCEPKLVIISDKLLYEKIRQVAEEASSKPKIYTFNQLPNTMNWNEIVELGRKHENEYRDKLQEIKKSIMPEDLATIIYTSGTTGFPKGVMLSHRNVMSNAVSAGTVHRFGPQHRMLSFLPICHILERVCNYQFQIAGVSIYYAESMGTIADNLKEIKPHVFISVPRLLESVYGKIINTGKGLSYIKKNLFFWSVNLGLKFDYVKKGGIFYRIMLKIANKLVFVKWRDALGGNIGLIMVGGAALQPRLSRIFGAAGIPVMEGYGLTESSPVIAVNNLISGEICVGTVGPAFENVQIKIAEDGEILAKGPNIMMGYYKEPEMTKETIDPDGWLHTGDIGVFVEDKYLKITDRKKEMFKLSSGKYIAPQVIENRFKESFFIEQVMVIGENQKFASAIIVPNFPFLHNWASIHKLSFQDNTNLISNPMVIARYQKEVSQMNSQLGQTERIKRFRLVVDEWTPNTGELSPTLKLKRKTLYDKYASLIEEIFAVDGGNGDD
jgi:long-chain acyl-CoA synthetase